MADEEAKGFGETLRSAREATGLSIDDVARTTRISARYLTALEEENWSVVPGAVIGRGFVRVVAREVKADPVALLDAYKRARGVEEEATAHNLPESDWRVDLRPRRGPRPILVMTGLFLVLVIAFLWFWPQRTVRQPLPEPAPVAGGESPPPAVVSPIAQPETAPPAVVEEPAPPQVQSPPPAELPEPVPAAAQGPVTLRVKAVEKVWVRVVADGGEQQDRILDPGEERDYQARETVRVRLGNAASVRLFWNGTALKVPGERGEVLTLQFPEAVESLLP